MDNIVPDCGAPGSLMRGDFCRCCGERLRGEGRIVFCDRQTPCAFCGRTTCGPHGNRAHDGMPARNFCEFEGSRCTPEGSCPEHEFDQAGFN
jgi:hypothetical protein